MSSDTRGVAEPDSFGTPSNLLGLMPQRSTGLKLLLVCALALLMAIPALFVYTVVYDRNARATDAIYAISERYGGQQIAMGPILVVPFERDVTNAEGRTITQNTALTIYPDTGKALIALRTERKSSGIHEVPIYDASVSFDGRLNPIRIQDNLPADARVNWRDARIYVGLSDTRAAREQTVIEIDGEERIVEPVLQDTGNPVYGRHPQTLLTARIPELESSRSPITLKASMRFSGAEKIAISPFARTTEIEIQGDWDDPKFEGGFQQKTYTGGGDGEGFKANWTIPYEARGIPGAQISMTGYKTMTASQNTVDVRLVMNATPYQSVQRALKYGVMFIGFVFLAYFLFEIVSQQRAHPAQYVLVGLAQSVFYLLLLALSEQSGFDFAFLIAAIMTVGMTSAYAMTVFRSRLYGLRALGIFSAVYALIYTLMRLEDYALLMGAFASFAAIGFTMYMTRNINWYGQRDPAPTPA